MKQHINRRQFISRSSILTLGVAMAPQIIPSTLLGETSPSNQITLGFIGMGGQGLGRNLKGFQASKLSRVLAVCDCNTKRNELAKAAVDEKAGNTDCDTYQDFREILARDDIDAVVISTPDHWHVPMSLMALEAGKHVFCEKPSLTMVEGRQLTEAVKKSGKVFQWGIEDRCLTKYWLLSGLARTGAIGEIQNVYCDILVKPLWDKENPVAVPKNLDWNLWLGPAPAVDYTPQVTHGQRWRQHDDYSGGSLTDWGSHLCDTAQVGIGMENSGPVEISGIAEKLPETSYVTAPYHYKVQYKYSNGATIHVVNKGKGMQAATVRFEGTKGWAEVSGWNGELKAHDREIFRNKTLGEHPDFWPRPQLEQPDFLQAIVDREHTPVYHAETGHRLAAMLHLGHLAIKEEKTVHWDPAKEAFTQDAQQMMANRVYQRESRDWTKGL